MNTRDRLILAAIAAILAIFTAWALPRIIASARALESAEVTRLASPPASENRP